MSFTEGREFVPGGVIETEPTYKGPKVDFLNFLGQRADHGGNEEDQQLNREMLDVNDLSNIDASCLPPDFHAHAVRFRSEDWDWVRNSPNQLLALYSASHGSDVVNTSESWGRWRDGDEEKNNIPSADLVAQLYKMSLVYQTSHKTLERIIDSGKVLSDRKYRELLQSQGKDPNNHEDYGEFSTHTFGEDRRAGLDDYVFTSFGRPLDTTDIYGAVQVLFKPDRLIEGNNSFATYRDYIDLTDADEQKGPDIYRDQVVNGSYFYRAVGREIVGSLMRKGSRNEQVMAEDYISHRTDQKDQYGRVTSGSWEVKAPTFTAEEIDKIVFTDFDTARRFQEKYGDRFTIVIKPGRQELTKVVSELSGNSNFAGTLNESQLLQWTKKYFAEHPSELSKYFGSLDVSFDEAEVYFLTDAKERYNKAFADELNSRSQKNVEEMEQMAEDDKEVVYLEFNDPLDLISPRTNIYRAHTGAMYKDLSQANGLLFQMKRRAAQPIIIPGQEPKFLPPPKISLAVVEVAKSELKAYERDFVRNPQNTYLWHSKLLTKYRVTDSLILE